MRKNKTVKKTGLTETEISRSICDYLDAKNYFFFRNNNTPIYDPVRKLFRKMPKFTPRGIPDIFLLQKGGIIIFLEVKTKSGKLSDSQIIFKDRCDKIGAQYHVVRSIDDVMVLGL